MHPYPSPTLPNTSLKSLTPKLTQLPNTHPSTHVFYIPTHQTFHLKNPPSHLKSPPPHLTNPPTHLTTLLNHPPTHFKTPPTQLIFVENTGLDTTPCCNTEYVVHVNPLYAFCSQLLIESTTTYLYKKRAKSWILEQRFQGSFPFWLHSQNADFLLHCCIIYTDAARYKPQCAKATTFATMHLLQSLLNPQIYNNTILTYLRMKSSTLDIGPLGHWEIGFWGFSTIML